MRHAAAVVSDEVALEFARTRGPIGTIGDIAQRVDLLVRAGATHFDLKAVIKSGPPREMDQSIRDMMDAFSESIIPRYSSPHG